MAPLAQVFDVGISLVADLGEFRRNTERGVGDAAEQAAETGGKRFKAAFSTVAAAAGLAVGAALAYGITQALSQQNASRLLAAQLGASPGEAARLGKLAGSLYASGFGENMEQVNEALRGVVQNGIAGLGDTDEAIKSAAANVTNLATLLGEDTQRVSQAISQMLRTGLAKSSTEAFDILVASTQKGINKSEDLLDTLNEYGTEFRELGLDGTQAMGLISQAIQAGARDSDTAADAIKEFSIRAQDGSKLSAAGFQALGIDANTAFAAVAGGGAPASAVLDQVLDKLRAMPASAERTALAVSLFGTKAEDLGDALFAMDLTSAGQQLGDVAGAAQRAGDTMASSATAQFDTFTRTIKQDLVEALMVAVPFLQSFGEWVNKNADWLIPLVGALTAFGAAIWVINAAMAAYATVQTIATALASTWLFRTIAINTQLAIYFARMAIVRGATIAWTAVQWLLNAAFVASPIGIIVLALGALVAAVILAWKHSETFRSIVLGAWEAIQNAAAAVWGFLKPIFEFWWASVQRMGAVYLWIWNEVIVPAMQGIQLAIQVAWVAIQIVFQLWRFYIMEIIVPAVMWLWEKAIKPTWDLIVAQVQFAWSLIKVVWDALVWYVRNVVAPVFTFLWQNVIKPAWDGIAATISGTWNNVIKPLFDFIMRFITEDVPAAWRRGVDLIGFWWNALKDLAKAPVRFVIETVVNKGIIGTFNKIADILPGIDKIKDVQLPAGFASGGPVFGAGGPRDDLVPAMLSNGEYVIDAGTVRRLGVRFFDALLGGPRRGVEKPGDGSGGLAFADGGLVDLITDPVGFVKSRVGLDNIPGGGTLRQVLVGMGGKLIGGLVAFAKDAVSKLISFGGGPISSIAPGNVGDVQRWLLGQHGKPYGWAQAGPGAYDCSGIVSAVWLAMHGQNPYRHIFSTSNEAGYFPRVGQFGVMTAGWANPGERGGGSVGHTAGVVGGMPFESTGSRGVRVNVAGITPVTSFAHFGTFASGGLVKLLDRGGPLRHREAGLNLSGQTEQTTPQATMLDVIDRLERLLDAVEQIAPQLGRVLGAGSSSLQMARTR
jgi:phage-related minor tail protein